MISTRMPSHEWPTRAAQDHGDRRKTGEMGWRVVFGQEQWVRLVARWGGGPAAQCPQCGGRWRLAQAQFMAGVIGSSANVGVVLRITTPW